MKTRLTSPSLILSCAFEQFLEVSSFARRTRESYTEDLVSLFAQIGHMPVTALTTDVIQSFLARQESPAPATYNRRLAALRSFTCWLRDQGGVSRNPAKTLVTTTCRIVCKTCHHVQPQPCTEHPGTVQAMLC
jgi:site-specific recombinase XerC